MNRASRREFLLVAVDPSAELHASRVLDEVKTSYGASAFGIGGPILRAAGLDILGDAKQLTAVGISEAVGAACKAWRLWRILEKEVQRRRPAVALLVDAPDFNLPLARRLEKLKIPVVYYIAPQVWAWRRRRVFKLKRRVRRLCVVLPFEEQFFRNYGLEVEYVGHPLMEERFEAKDTRPNRVLLLPGSRRLEVQRLLPLLVETAQILRSKHPELIFQLPIAPGLDRYWIEKLLSGCPLPLELEPAGTRACLKGAKLALCASGTVTLEAALADVPQLVCYRLSHLSYFLARLLVRVKYVCLVNLLLDRSLVPEFIQSSARPKLMAQEALRLLEDESWRQRLLEGYRRARELLGEKKPAKRVARIVGDTAGW